MNDVESAGVACRHIGAHRRATGAQARRPPAVELAPRSGVRHQPGSLIMAAISAVFTIGYVASCEDWLHQPPGLPHRSGTPPSGAAPARTRAYRLPHTHRIVCHLIHSRLLHRIKGMISVVRLRPVCWFSVRTSRSRPPYGSARCEFADLVFRTLAVPIVGAVPVDHAQLSSHVPGISQELLA